MVQNGYDYNKCNGMAYIPGPTWLLLYSIYPFYCVKCFIKIKLATLKDNVRTTRMKEPLNTCKN